MSQNWGQIQQPLKIALQKLITHLFVGKQIEENYLVLKQKKDYNKREKRYICEERHCLPEHRIQNAGCEDDDSDTDSETEQNYKKLDEVQLSYLMRRKLINQNFDPEILPEVNLLNPDSQQKIMQEQIDSASDVCDSEGIYVSQGQKAIIQSNQIYAEDALKHKNLSALKFLIKELQTMVV